MRERPTEPAAARVRPSNDAAPRIAAAYVVGLCLVAAGLAAIAISLAPPASEQDPSADVVAHLGLVIGLCTGGLILASSATTRAKAVGLAVLVSIYLATAAALTLSGSKFGPFGYSVDQSFRTAYVTKLAHHWGPVDWGYDGLPWTYPPLYFLSLGRMSDVLGIAAWQMIKTGLFVVAFLVPVVTLGLWSRIVGWARAGALAIAALLVQEWYEPYAWLAVALFVPWWLLIWRAERSWRSVVMLGLLGMAVATLYPYYLGAGLLLWGGSVVIGRFTSFAHLQTPTQLIGSLVRRQRESSSSTRLRSVGSNEHAPRHWTSSSSRRTTRTGVERFVQPTGGTTVTSARR